MHNKDSVLNKMNESFSLGGDGSLRYLNRLCVPNVNDLRSSILAEAHGYCYSIHPGTTKMYQDLKKVYRLESMNRDISKFVEECPNCQQVKAEHLKTGGLTQTIEIQTSKWEAINMDVVVGLPMTRKLQD